MRSFGRCAEAWVRVHGRNQPGQGSTRRRPCAAALIALALMLAPGLSHGQSTQAADLYKQALAREAQLRQQLDTLPASSPRAADIVVRMRTLAQTYEDLWKLFPTSGYSDNALWQGAMLAADLFWQAGDPADRTTALQLLKALTANFPTSSLLKQVPAQRTRLEAAKPAAPASTTRTTVPPAATPAAPAPPSAAQAMRTPAPAASPIAPPAVSRYAMLTAIRRDVLPDTLRVTLELEREPVFNWERIDGPPRVFIDMQNTQAAAPLKDASLPFPDDVVRRIRVGRQLNGRTRVVLDLSGAGKYSVYALYEPFRIVIDFERKAAVPVTRQATTTVKDDAGATWAPPGAAPAATPGIASSATAPVQPKPPGTTGSTPPGAGPAPTVAVPAAAPPPPTTNSTGSFSLSRQLGLGVARVVIDPGHGGHDPGAKVRGLTEADLTLDIALRLEKLLAKQPGVEVVLTRRTDSYVPLEERTAIANRAEADLFLSIHANASDAASARGIETYFLNFAPNSDAEAVAARENATSGKTMRNLPDIVKAIALNDKIDESRDFASMVQAEMYAKLRKSNRTVRSLGVKQAPFMVLIGATMPSILAEVSFITNKQEGALLKTEKYRQQIAEALFEGVMRYQQSLKKVPALALDASTRPGPR